MAGKKNKPLSIFFALLTAMGFICLLYPAVSNIVNTINEGRVIQRYEDKTEKMTSESYKEELAEAMEYNRRLYEADDPLFAPDQVKGYEQTLDPDGNGVMGILNIPKINLRTPIFHGTDGAILKNSAGHLKGSSFPIEGDNVHAVIAAHRGMSSARLFTDADELETGDTFSIEALNRIMVYEVDNIEVVLPEETNRLEIVKGQNYVTLQTCTPYGVNSHRLLVRGRLVETVDKDNSHADDFKTDESVQGVFFNKRNIVPIAVSLFIVFLFLTVNTVNKRKKR